MNPAFLYGNYSQKWIKEFFFHKRDDNNSSQRRNSFSPSPYTLSARKIANHRFCKRESNL